MTFSILESKPELMGRRNGRRWSKLRTITSSILERKPELMERRNGRRLVTPVRARYPTPQIGRTGSLARLRIARRQDRHTWSKSMLKSPRRRNGRKTKKEVLVITNPRTTGTLLEKMATQAQKR
jgi:hypothetical protein